MTRYSVASDVPVIFTVEAEDEEAAQRAVDTLWAPAWKAMSDAVEKTGDVHLGEWYDDTDVWEDTDTPTTHMRTISRDT